MQGAYGQVVRTSGELQDFFRRDRLRVECYNLTEILGKPPASERSCIVAQLKLNLGREVELRVFNGDCAKVLPELEANLIQCCVTSPPYWGLRDYDHPDQIGAEASPDLYVKNLVLVFREVRRTLRDDGTLWLNVGDGYARNGGTGKCGPNAVVGNTKKLIQKRNCKVPEKKVRSQSRFCVSIE